MLGSVLQKVWKAHVLSIKILNEDVLHISEFDVVIRVANINIGLLLKKGYLGISVRTFHKNCALAERNRTKANE